MQEINVIAENTEPKRIDAYLADTTDLTRTHITLLISEKKVTVNGRAVSKSYKVKKGDSIEVKIPEPTALNIEKENIPLDIVYEDESLLVVNKPKGMVVHPAVGNQSGTLVNALLYHCEGRLSGINGVERPGIVHRIDKDTSGLLMVAKNDKAHLCLAEQIKEHSFKREYEAVVYGVIKNETGTVNAPIGRHPVKRKQFAVTSENSKNAVTHYEVVKRYEGFTHIRLRLETGRTHQIRVHMAYLGHPVAGDPVYGPKKVIEALGGQCLHAKRLGFIHPETQKYLEFSSELPSYFTDFLNNLKGCI